MQKRILFDEQGLQKGTPYIPGQWKEIAVHDDVAVKGFFGEYRFLSNFWPAKVFIDDEEFPCVENAYQAAKYKSDVREYFKTCTAKEAIIFVNDNPLSYDEIKAWDAKKLEVMEKLLQNKFDKEINPELAKLLISTGNKFLEETNYWGDTYWGVHKTNKEEGGAGENNLGKLLMKIRSELS